MELVGREGPGVAAKYDSKNTFVYVIPVKTKNMRKCQINQG